MANLKIVIGAVTKGLNTAAGKFKTFASKVGGFLTSKLGMILGTGSAAALGRSAGRMIDRLDGIGKAAKRMGVSAEEFQKLTFAARRSGASSQDMEKAFKRMASTIVDAGTGLKESQRALEALGLSADKLKGKSPEEQFSIIADALADVTDHTEKAALAQDLFGRAGTNLIPMINNYRQLGDEIKRIGGIIDNETVAAAERAADSLENLKVRAAAASAKGGFVQSWDLYFKSLNNYLDRVGKDKSTVGRVGGTLLSPLAAYIDAVAAPQVIDQRSKSEIQEQIKAFKRSKTARLAGESSTTSTTSEAAALLGGAGQLGKVDALRAIGANSAGGGGVVSELSSQTSLLREINDNLRPQTRWEHERFRREFHQHLRAMNTTTDGAK